MWYHQEKRNQMLVYQETERTGAKLDMSFLDTNYCQSNNSFFCKEKPNPQCDADKFRKNDKLVEDCDFQKFIDELKLGKDKGKNTKQSIFLYFMIFKTIFPLFQNKFNYENMGCLKHFSKIYKSIYLLLL